MMLLNILKPLSYGLENRKKIMKSAIVRIEKHTGGYWATVLPHVYKNRFPVFFRYDTDFFEEIQEAEWEAKAFCK